MRGYFGIGVEGVSKAMNAGSLFRTAHAFGASFVFTVGSAVSRREIEKSDTSKSWQHLPYYEFASAGELRLPAGCALVGIELLSDAVDLPSFRHPSAAAYILGPERGALSDSVLALCDYRVKIPTRFSINLALAGALAMYDRLISFGRFAGRPIAAGGEAETRALPRFGPPRVRSARARATKEAKRAP
jgi:tRNA G18 (ribose-2'-O)-methylase SpoU